MSRPLLPPRFTDLEWQALLDALLFTETHAGAVSDAHLRAKEKVESMLVWGRNCLRLKGSDK